MDPLTALGLASNVVQMVSFTSDLISKTRKIHHSASRSLIENAELESIVRTLQSHNRRLAQQMGSGKSSANNPDHGAARDMLVLCEGVRDLCKQLIDVIESLKRPEHATRWDSFRQALRSVWKESEVQDLGRRLQQYRAQIDSLVLANIQERMESLSKKMDDRDGKMMDSYVNKMMESLAGGSKWQLDTVRAAIQAKGELGRSNSRQLDLVSAQLDAGAKEERDRTIEKRLLESLKFSDMRDRYERIPEAHKQTFEWAFRDAHEVNGLGRQPWDNFNTWLMSNKSLYWVTGKPGAGKSTLMKFLNDEQRLRARLKIWQRDLPVHIGCYFFWNSGTQMQMSKIGLLQSLLYQTISKFPKETRHIFADRWRYQELFGFDGRPWTWSELSAAFSKLVSDTSQAFFFLIDGLDEFDGDCAELASYLLGLLKPGRHLKLCLASRPWLVFEDAFQRQPSLRIEDLTSQDIRIYASEKLVDHAMFAQLQKLDQRSARALISEITERASGVFLWVTLVVKSLLDGLRDGDKLEDLQARLLQLPRDLEALFQKILSDLDLVYFEQASQIFQAVRASYLPWREFSMSYKDMDEGDRGKREENVQNVWSPPMLLSLSFIGDSVDVPLANGTNDGILRPEEQIYHAEAMRRRLYSRCKGLLEVAEFAQHGPAAKVEYLHRTVKDFMEEDGAREFLKTDASFDPHLNLCAAFLRHTQAIRPIEDEMESLRVFADLLQEFTMQCHWLERQHRAAYVPYLSAMSEIAETTLGGPDDGLPHWTRRVDPYVGTKENKVTNLLEYAVIRKLDKYVEDQGDLGRAAVERLATD